jgi:hypothetical protein
MTTCADCGREYRFMPDLGCPHCARSHECERLRAELARACARADMLAEQLDFRDRDCAFWRRLAGKLGAALQAASS